MGLGASMRFVGFANGLARAVERGRHAWDETVELARARRKRGSLIANVGARHAVPLREHDPVQHFSQGSASERPYGRWYCP